MATMKIILVCLLFIDSYGLRTGFSLENLQQFLQRTKPEPCATDGSRDHICFHGSEKIPHQMSFLNVSAGSGAILDNIAKRVGILHNSGKGIILDHKNQNGVQFTEEKTSVEKFLDMVKDYNVSDSYEQHQENKFSYDENGLSETSTQNKAEFDISDFLLNTLPTFGIKFFEHVKEIMGKANSIVYSAVKVLDEIMKPVASVLAPVITLATKSVLLMFPGVLGTLKIITTLAAFAMRIVGGVGTLILSNTNFPLGGMLGNTNGLKTFFQVLYEISNNLELEKVIKFVLGNPLMIYETVAGLGGMVLHGVTGIFTIIFHIVKLLSRGIVKSVIPGIKFITDRILRFFGIRKSEIKESKNPKKIEGDKKTLLESAGLLVDLVKSQSTSAGTSLKPLLNFAEGIMGKQPLVTSGIQISEIIRILLDPNIKSGFEMATAIIKIFVPFKIPKLASLAMGHLFSNGVSLLSHENDLNYVRHILPDVVLPPKGEFRIQAQVLTHPTVLDLPTYQLIESVPTLHTVFHSLDEYSMRYFNVCLVRELETNPEFNNLINLGIRRVVAF